MGCSWRWRCPGCVLGVCWAGLGGACWAKLGWVCAGIWPGLAGTWGWAGRQAGRQAGGGAGGQAGEQAGRVTGCCNASLRASCDPSPALLAACAALADEQQLAAGPLIGGEVLCSASTPGDGGGARLTSPSPSLLVGCVAAGAGWWAGGRARQVRQRPCRACGHLRQLPQQAERCRRSPAARGLPGTLTSAGVHARHLASLLVPLPD
jgi:hypothetical protein